MPAGSNLHLAIDDHSRLAYAELLPSESPADCVAFLRRAVAWYADRGIAIERVLSDNGNGYRSHAWAAACAELGLARRYTRPRRPQTNGKAEALVKTLLREWAYRFAYPTSGHRARALPGYLRWYNQHRPHSSLGGRPPISRVSQLCRSHS
jgi:transposase InsO family protein